MRTIAFASVLLIAACGGREQSSSDQAAGSAGKVALGAPSPAAAASTAAASFEDPEPPDAQARAEAVLNAPFNRDKKTSIAMRMTTIVGRTSTVSGFATAMVAREESIDQTKSRLLAKETETEVIIQLPGSILFDFDSAKIRPDAERTLNDVQKVVNSYAGRPVRVDGHTDSIASDSYNLKLSEERARSVVAWLNSHGVDGSRLKANGLGETKPVATNDTAAGRQLNRRVEIVIAKK